MATKISNCKHKVPYTNEGAKKRLRLVQSLVTDLQEVIQLDKQATKCQGIISLSCQHCFSNGINNNKDSMQQFMDAVHNKVRCIIVAYFFIRPHCKYHFIDDQCNKCTYIICKDHNIATDVCDEKIKKPTEVIH